jgi:hypothetical protein
MAAVVLVGCFTMPFAARPTREAKAAASPLDCANWRYGAADEPASLPTEFDRNDYKRTSLRDPSLADSPQNQCGQKGSAVDLAWGITEGRPDIAIAVLDSGIEWRDAGAMADLATKVRINIGEAKPPCIATQPDGDCNHDGTFDITDFGALPDRNGNGLADPEDLILDPAFSNGVDDDHDGYVDDIAGWDFLHGDNDPLDTVEYGHGTGEAKDSTAAANGTGSVGTCPKCQFIPVRVGDSFIADGGRFAAGVLFALDSGAKVIQEALGAISNPPQAQQAIDAAYAANVVIVASMADEASKHPNLPSSLEHTLAVNSVTSRGSGLLGDGPTTSYLALNGCTNFGGRTFVSVPSSSCSSEATGEMAGIVGLIESEAAHQGVTLTADEVMQIVRATADDIDFATPNAHDPANNFGTPTGNPLVDTVRYPTTPGWDATFGYGRINAYEMIKAVRDARIPPEAMIDGPSWFALLGTTGSVPVTGHVAAPRATSYDYDVQWTTGLQPPAYPGVDTWHSIGGGTGLTAAKDGTLAQLDLAQVAAALPDAGTGTPVDAADANRPDEDRFSVRLRVVVTAHGGATDGKRGEMQKQVFVHDDPDLVAGFPKDVPGVSTATPRFADLLGDGRTEMLVATSDGVLHAYRSDGSELPGFPVASDPAPWWPTGSAAAAQHHISQPGGAFMMGAPAVGDLHRDGHLEIVETDLDGRVMVWSATGQRLATMHVNPAWSADDPATQNPENRTFGGFASAPSLGDLDGDGTLEIVAAAMDRHVYAWHADGTPVAGFPVLVVDPTAVQAVDPTSHSVTFAPGAKALDGGELIATPTLADLDGDGHPDIVIGAQEEYDEAPNIGDGADVLSLLSVAASPGNTRLYAISSKGTAAAPPPAGSANPDAGAYLPGWPAKLAMITTEVLPTIGDGVLMPAAVGDVDPDHPGVEVVAASAVGTLDVLGTDGKGVYGSTATGDVPAVWSAGVGLPRAADFGADRNSQDIAASLVAFSGPALGELSGDAAKEPATPTVGLSRLLDFNLSDRQLPSDDQLTAWDGATRKVLPGFPQTTSDMAFFVTPAIADVDGDGRAEVIAGNGVNTLNAFDADGTSPAGWPKMTGGWTVGTPAVGDWDGDGTVEVAQTRRDGMLLVWHTTSAATPEWGSWSCDAYNSGSCVDTAAAVIPPPTTTTTTTTTAVAPTTTLSSTSSTAPAAVPEQTPSGSDGSGSGGLALTGAMIGGLVVAGLALVALGLGLGFLRRRGGTR